MRFASRVTSTLSLLGIVFPLCVLAQDTTRVAVEGTVIDSRSGLPVEGVELTLAELGVVRLTDSAGVFSFPDLALGTYHLALRKDGYRRAEGPLQILRPGGMVIRLDPSSSAVESEASRIQGVVRDLVSNQPLEGALVSIEGVRLNQVSGPNGRFALTNIPPGPRGLVVSLLGYSTRTDSIVVPPASVLTLDVGLTVEPIRLDPIDISVEARNLDLELSGFYDRRDASSGIFITRERIEERAPIFTTDIFQGLPGVRVAGGLGMGTQKAVTVIGSRVLTFSVLPGECHPAVWIDGQLIHKGAASPIPDGPAFLDDYVQPEMIAGIEIYNSGAKVPLQYNLFSACGVIVIWTRHGK